MTRTLLILLLSFFLTKASIAQNTSRINNIENKLEILKVETPGLSEEININIAQTTLSNFLLAISEVHGININVAPNLSEINIVNNFSNVTVQDILLFLVKEYNLEIDFTGNILSIKQYNEPPVKVEEKEILVQYAPASGTLSLDLKNDKLEKVFRKIMDVSGKNLLFTPDIQSNLLTIYINNVPFETALQQLAETNNLLFSKSNSGFYTFESAMTSSRPDADGIVSTSPVRKRKATFNYQIVDTINKIISVDFQNTPVADVIYTLGEELGINIFTASPLENAGLATVKAQNMEFDVLLNKIFESALTTNNLPENNRQEFTAAGGSTGFTYKKENNMYYFGTEDQLSLKQVELVTMMHRSVQMLSNPSANGQRRAGRNNFNNNTNFYNPTTSNNQNFNQPLNTSFRDSNPSASDIKKNTTAIIDIIPEDIKAGLDIKIDTELNSFVISGPGVKVERFKNFIQYIDKPVPVIIIEVMILEVNRSSMFETGVSFGLGEEPSETSGSVFPSTDIRLGADRVNKIIGSFNGFGSLNLGNVLPEFYLDIKALESNGNIKILSTPKLSTINGHKAYLSSGQTTYYAVTTQTFFGSQIPQTSEITNYVPIDAELALEILPFVSGDGQITLDIQVIQSSFNGERIAEDAPPGINSREFSSIIRMRDQDVAILGGIEEVRKDDSGSGVPFLARIPIIKYLFSERRREDSKRKLNILIKPTVLY